MEGFVWALMANSGTDPELEEEELQKKQKLIEELRKRELELRYLVKLDDAEEGEDRDESSVDRRLLEDAEERISNEKPVLDHYSTIWPPGETSPLPPNWAPNLRSKSMEKSPRDNVGRSKPVGFSPNLSDGSNSSPVLPTVPEWSEPVYLVKLVDDSNGKVQLADRKYKFAGNIRPSRFPAGISPQSYVPIPKLELSLPNFPRHPIPLGPVRAEEKVVPLEIRRRKLICINRACCKPPSDPIEGLYHLSSAVLRKHYNSFNEVCFVQVSEN